VSPALSDLPVRDVARVLRAAGFERVRVKGSHAVYRDADGRVAVVPEYGTIKRGNPGLDLAAGRPDHGRLPQAPRLARPEGSPGHAGHPCRQLWHRPGHAHATIRPFCSGLREVSRSVVAGTRIVICWILERVLRRKISC